MATYKIFENGVLTNTIVADETFCKAYCAKHGFTYELMPKPEPVEPTGPVPTLDERVTDLEDALAATDETAIELYEAMMAQEEINTAQDDALIELYEMIGG